MATELLYSSMQCFSLTSKAAGEDGRRVSFNFYILIFWSLSCFTTLLPAHFQGSGFGEGGKPVMKCLSRISLWLWLPGEVQSGRENMMKCFWVHSHRGCRWPGGRQHSGRLMKCSNQAATLGVYTGRLKFLCLSAATLTILATRPMFQGRMGPSVNIYLVWVAKWAPTPSPQKKTALGWCFPSSAIIKLHEMFWCSFPGWQQLSRSGRVMFFKTIKRQKMCQQTFHCCCWWEVLSGR